MKHLVKEICRLIIGYEVKVQSKQLMKNTKLKYFFLRNHFATYQLTSRAHKSKMMIGYAIVSQFSFKSLQNVWRKR